jgi:predicted ATPase/DNA-binding winged helix-turn-helix (wHTH) protein
MSGDAPSRMPPLDSETVTFGQFELRPGPRQLLRDGVALRIGSHALDILIVLVDSAGGIVRKEDLISRAWPHGLADENTLRVHISALRRALRDDGVEERYITTIPGRGYSFTAPVHHAAGDSTNAAPVVAPRPPSNTPAVLSPVIGRDDIIAKLADQLSQHRLLTILGPGGIGKTTVAIAVAERARAGFRDGVWFVDLASLVDPALLPNSIAASLGIQLPVANPASGLAEALKARRALLVLDNCEHVINAAAVLAETVLRVAPGISILATSREPLRAEGEWLHRLASLDWPSSTRGLSPQAALAHSAVQFFHQRVLASMDSFQITDGNLEAVLDICRLLDGVPLSLELAAVRVQAFGVEGVAARLDDRFTLLSKGRRTALPRQQTLRATMDWSYELLAPQERTFLQRLSIFRGSFSVAAAVAVAATESITPDDIFINVANLVAKSLVVADRTGNVTRHRLLDTTRAYALEKLEHSGEAEQIRRRHARYCLDLFEKAEAEWERRDTAEWVADYAPQVDNLHAALDWAFGPQGDAEVAVALTAAALPLWVQMSLVDECHRRVTEALACVEGVLSPDPRLQMKLFAALGGSLLYVKGPTQETEVAWVWALASAEAAGDSEYQLRALWGLWVHHMNRGEFGTGLTLARKFLDLARLQSGPEDIAIGERMIGTSLHYRGDQAEARSHVERMLMYYVEPARRPPSTRFRFDQKVVARVTLARILWIQGFPEQAWQLAQNTVDEADALNQPVTYCFALAEVGCPIALFVGDLAVADHYVSSLLGASKMHALPIWQSWGHRFRGALLMRQGAQADGVELLRTSLDHPPEASFQPRFTWFLGQLALGLARSGQPIQGMQAIDEALSRSERNDDRWCLAESLRIKGELLAQHDADASAAEQCFLQSLDCARRQGALSWELRTAISLTRLHQQDGGRASGTLEAVYRRFTEGFATADLQEAKALLDTMGQGLRLGQQGDDGLGG